MLVGLCSLVRLSVVSGAADAACISSELLHTERHHMTHLCVVCVCVRFTDTVQRDGALLRGGALGARHRSLVPCALFTPPSHVASSSHDSARAERAQPGA